MEIIGYKLKNKIDGYSTKVGSICYDKQYFNKYKNDLNFEPVYETTETPKEVIPEYVEALIDVSGYFIKGNIYKVESSQNIKSCRLISNIKSGSHSAGTILLVDLSNNNRFEPSTKSAFDAQNQSKKLSEQTANNISETIDRVRYRAMRIAQADMLENALKSFTCDIQHYDHEFLAQMLGGKVSKVNKVQISTDNEIKINIIQKQSIKI